MTTYPANFLGWLHQAGADMYLALTDWTAGRLTELVIGHAWDVVRLPHHEGTAALQQLRALQVPLGPALSSPHGIEVLLALGAAVGWELPDAPLLPRGNVLRGPRPSILAPAQPGAPYWIVPPDDRLLLTPADDLYGAYVSARAVVRKEDSS